MNEDFSWKPKRQRPNRNRKVRAIQEVLELLGVAHPKYGGKQTWYVEKIEPGVVNAIVIEERRTTGKVHHAVQIVLPHDAPSITRYIPGIAAALGLAEMVSNASKKHLPPMDDLVARIFNCSHTEVPFRFSVKWAPLIVCESIGKLTSHPSWMIVTTWDDALKKYKRLAEYLIATLGGEALETTRTRLRHLCLPVTQENYNLQKVRCFGAEHLKADAIYISGFRVPVMDYIPKD